MKHQKTKHGDEVEAENEETDDGDKNEDPEDSDKAEYIQRLLRYQVNVAIA